MAVSRTSNSYINGPSLSHSAWLEVRLFYVRISPCVIDSAPDHLNLRHLRREIGVSLEINGSQIPASDSVSVALRCDRLNKESSEVTYVSTDIIRVTGSVEFEVYEKEELILCGSLERMETNWVNGSVGLENNSKTGWTVDCFMAASMCSGSSAFFQPKLGVKAMATTLSVRPNRLAGGAAYPPQPAHRTGSIFTGKLTPWKGVSISLISRSPATTASPLQAGSRADDSSPFEMSVEIALKVLGVSDSASFDEILRARNSILATCKDDQETVAQVEAAYDMLLMRSLTQRRAGKVVSSRILYADVKPINEPQTVLAPQWLQASMKNTQLSIEAPTVSDFGIQAGVYGALMVLTYVNGAATSTTMTYDGADVPGLILASSFGASLYFMTKRNVKLGKASIIVTCGLVAGAVVGSAVENWLQVDIVPFLGLHSPAAVISEFILFSEFLVSLCLV